MVSDEVLRERAEKKREMDRLGAKRFVFVFIDSCFKTYYPRRRDTEKVQRKQLKTEISNLKVFLGP